MLSISTGRYPRYLNSMDGDWGWTQWARPIIEIMLEGNVGVAHYQCSRVLGERYHRLDPELPEAISLDDLDNIPQLKELGEHVDLTETITWLEQHFDENTEN